MKDEWLDRWNTRYQAEEYAYGTEPNQFLREKIQNLKPGKILFGAEGEGRNAVYAAKLGWDVFAFDISVEGRKKALELAEKHNVSMDYQVGFLPELDFKKEDFDVVALIYAHFPKNIKSEYHQILNETLKIGGIIIFEAFGKKHLDYRNQNEKIGGPTDLESLFSIEEIKNDFKGYEILQLEEVEVELSEGLYHNGKGSVVRFIGKKI